VTEVGHPAKAERLAGAGRFAGDGDPLLLPAGELARKMLAPGFRGRRDRGEPSCPCPAVGSNQQLGRARATGFPLRHPKGEPVPEPNALGGDDVGCQPTGLASPPLDTAPPANGRAEECRAASLEILSRASADSQVGARDFSSRSQQGRSRTERVQRPVSSSPTTTAPCAERSVSRSNSKATRSSSRRTASRRWRSSMTRATHRTSSCSTS
jgi:hypothetical protein